MPLSAQLAKLLTRGAKELMSSAPGVIMKHETTLRVLTPEEEADLFTTYGKEPSRTPDLAKGGVVDMRNGGRVGAAVVAASLMASGGQAMDMRQGGVVGMVQGGPILDYTTSEKDEFNPDYDAFAEVSKQMDALLAKRQAAVDYGGFEQPTPTPVPPIPEMNPQHTRSRASRNIMSGLIGEVEGVTWERDTVRSKKYPKGMLTSPYGINTRDHAKLLEELRIQNNVTKLQDIPKKALKEAALNIFSRMGNEYAIGNRGVTPAEWRSLSKEGQFVVTDATFNTGDQYPLLTKALIKYESNPTLANLSAAVKQTWRKGGAGAQKGADNRAVKDLIAGGFIDLSKPEHRNILKKHLSKYSL